MGPPVKARSGSRWTRIAAMLSLSLVFGTVVLVAVWQAAAPAVELDENGRPCPNGRCSSPRRARPSSSPAPKPASVADKPPPVIAAACGIHSLGEGHFVQVIATPSGQLQFQLMHDMSWRVREVPASTPQHVRGLERRGALHYADWRHGHSPGIWAEWLVGESTIAVIVGTQGDDRFVRPPSVSRCLFLGFGGTDTVAYSGSRYQSPGANDRYVGVDGKAVAPATPVALFDVPELEPGVLPGRQTVVPAYVHNKEGK